MTITKTTVLDLEPANANWIVTVEREDYADPGEAPGILLSVGRTTVMLTPAEARRVGEALMVTSQCPKCHGLGRLRTQFTCPDCDGSGLAT